MVEIKSSGADETLNLLTVNNSNLSVQSIDNNTSKKSNRSSSRQNRFKQQATHRSARKQTNSYSPDFKHGEPDANILLQLQKLTESVNTPNYDKIAARAAHEMIGLIEMQEKLKATFDFGYLQKLLRSVVTSLANHNKHLVYLLNKQLNRNNMTYLKANEHENEIKNIKNILNSSQIQMRMIKEEFMRREDNFIRFESKIELANASNSEIKANMAKIDSKFNELC